MSATMELDGIALRAQRGRPLAADKLPPSFLRMLDEKDVKTSMPAVTHRGTGGLFDIKAMRASHHLLAMTLAAGASDINAAFVTGYSIATVRQCKSSPMFQELLAYYKEQKSEEFRDFAKQAAAVGMDALQIMRERMEQDPDSIKFKELTELMSTLLDRTVLPSKAAPASATNVAVSIQPITRIEFVESPHAQAAPPRDKIIEAKAKQIEDQSS